jgi:hypothetical protein
LVISLAISLLPSGVAAQTASTSAIAGMAKDATGAVLPGVTVEAASPALIEKVRTVLTDAEGNYKLLDLRPGTYSVTFSLAGFSSVKREGIELMTGFTANVNAEMRVGNIQETVTVSGETPVVDVQNSRVQTVLSKELLNSAPTGAQTIYSFMAMTVGVVTAQKTSQDVGGTAASFGGGPEYHGINATDSKSKVDGMDYNTLQGSAGAGSRDYHPNMMAYGEVNLGLGAQTAESETGGVVQNFVPKEGANRFSATGIVAYANSHFQSGNLTSDLQARGLTDDGGIDRIWDYGASVGGPIQQDKLWFYVAARSWGARNQLPGGFYNLTQHTPFYTPDLSRPAIQDFWDHDLTGRLTWQVRPTHKVMFSYVEQRNCFCTTSASSAQAPESAVSFDRFPRIMQGTWTHTASNRLLFEGGVSFVRNHGDVVPTGDVLPTDVSIVDQAGISYGAAASTNFTSQSPQYATGNYSDPLHTRLSASYITGSHAFKVGLAYMEGWHNQGININQSVQYTFLNRIPISLTEFATPFSEDLRVRSTGIYAQDQWTMRKMTLSLGARFDYFKGWVRPLDLPAGRFVPARSFGEVDDVPNYKDINPRLGAAYDVFGDGKTAVKASFGRYVGSLGAGLTEQNDPALLMVTNTARTWTDANGNYVPDCVLTNTAANGECGAIQNSRFGTLVPGTTIADNVLRGWGNRTYDWQTTLGLQQQLWPGFAATITYAHNMYGNILAQVNTAVTASDFTSYCVTAPADPRLPGGGGNRICGLYDVNPNKFGQVSNLIERASDLGVGDVTRYFNGVDLTINGRFGKGGQFSGGMSVGRTVQDDCALNQLPQAFATGMAFVLNGGDVTLGGSSHPRTTDFCHVAPPWGDTAQVKLTAVYPLPWYGVEVSGVFQNIPGIPDTASRTYTNAELLPELGRNVSTGTVSVPVLAPQTKFEDRLTQLDFRLAKAFRVGGKGRVKANVDVYNLFNANTITRINGAYGARWLNVTQIMTGRFVRVGGQVDF